MPHRSTTNWTSTSSPVVRRVSGFVLTNPEVREVSGFVLTNPELKRVQGLNIDEPLAMLRSGATSYYEADGLGSITSLSNSSGSVVQTYNYYGVTSFGTHSSSGSITNPFRFTAREYDESGLYFYRARYYDPQSGRFLSEDPARFAGGINFFPYAYNDSINLNDPRGLQACCAQKQVPAIRKRINGVRNFLDQLDSKGTISITGTVTPLAETFCQGFKIRGHEDIRLPSQATTVFVDPLFGKRQPCLFKCAEEHEGLHRRQCVKIGADKYGNLTEKQKEFPAYMVELGCLIKELQDAGLDSSF